MDRSKRDLEALVVSQKEQLLRFEKRLKDVVTAYKGILKEKEALETSLLALTSNKETLVTSDALKNSTKTSIIDGKNSTATSIECSEKDKVNLQSQIITLMNSLATLSAEKSRMEASFQSDKKQLRVQLAQKDKEITECTRQRQESEEVFKLEVQKMKGKWLIECQEREKETSNQMLIIRELQKLFADERHLKDNIEMQLNNLKTQFASNDTDSAQLRELQQQLKEAKMQLKQFEMQGKQLVESDDNTVVLKQLQQEMQQLKEQHAIAIKSEQRRVLLAEEQSRQQAALHEQRVANLEARLAELSSTVGNYDRLREQDQSNIQSLKQQLQQLKLVQVAPVAIETGSSNVQDVMTIVQEIVRLKKQLIQQNAQTAHPIDLNKIFAGNSDHVQCQEQLSHNRQQYDSAQKDITRLQEQLQVQKTHIVTLQEKVKVLNRNIDEQELELKRQSEQQRQSIKQERLKWKNKVAELENDSRCKLQELEQQLQKQRQRSLQLLEEKEQEIKALKTSFEIFHSGNVPKASEPNVTNSSDAESTEGDYVSPHGVAVKSKKLSVGENCHMLHYANELARKDIEITNLRKSKYAAETASRKAVQDKVSAQEELSDKITLLEEEVDRLERCKTREGANLEYLKNVIISFIVTRDAEGKRHMLNAISAVLQFNPTEMQTINSAFQKK